jgi:hypothetical protein
MAPRPLALLLSLLALAASAVATTTGYGTAYGGESLQDRMWRRLILLGSPAAGCGGQLASCLLALTAADRLALSLLEPVMSCHLTPLLALAIVCSRWRH